MPTPRPVPQFTRRALLGGLIGGGLWSALPQSVRAASQPRQGVLANGVRTFELVAQKAAVSLVGSQYPNTHVWCYSGQAPGPVLRATQGERVRIHVTNTLDQATTVHWHGLRIPNGQDGVPGISQAPIEPGESFVYEFDLPDAGTFWYHSHVSTSEQIARGLHGTFIVDEKNPPTVDRDVLWVLDDWRLGNDAQIADDFGQGMDISHAGRIGNAVTVNGSLPDTFTVRAGERIRLRLVNVANARIFGLAFADHTPTVIAYDGHPVTPHTPDGLLVLGPGQRADLILDCTGKPGQSSVISDQAYQEQGYRLFDMVYGPEDALRRAPDPMVTLADNPLSEPNLETAQRFDLVIDGGAMGSMQGATFEGQYLSVQELIQHRRIWSLNGVAAHTTAMESTMTLKRGASVIVTVKNDTAFPHPMHLHGHAFRIISQDGVADPIKPWADTVLMPPRASAEIAFVADNLGDWLFHCHVLEHVAGGMTSVIRVA